jgi:uncharacterized protein YxeA
MTDEKVKEPIHKRHLLAWLDKPWKRILFAVLLVLVLCAIGALIYWYTVIEMPGNKVVTDDSSTNVVTTSAPAASTTTTPTVPAGTDTGTKKTTTTSSSAAASTTPSSGAVTPPETPAPARMKVTLGTAFASPASINSLGGAVKAWFWFPVTVDKAGTMTYRFVRSNGYQSQVYSSDFVQAGTVNILDSWDFPANTWFNGWEYIQVITPSAQTSNRADININAVP